MSSKIVTSSPVSIDRAASSGIVSRTSWGEESRIRIGPADSGGQLTVLDYRAPPSFGPPRHLHHREDEVLELIEGQALVWTQNLSWLQQNHVLVLREDPFIPFGLERQHRGYWECREGSPGSDAGSCPRRAPTDGLVRLH